MSDDRPPRLSGWCSPTDQYHDGCLSASCECPRHADADSLVAQGKVVAGAYDKGTKREPDRANESDSLTCPTRYIEQRGLIVMLDDENPAPPSPTETLRRAAALMRERAEAATPHQRWVAWAGDTAVRVNDRSHTDFRAPTPAHAEHVASWHPAVALKVADWLEEVAAWMDEGVGLLPATNIGDVWIGMRQHALALARAYLGGGDRV